MNELLPFPGASGQWRLKAPFDTKIVSGLAYSCRSVRKIGEIIAHGVDVYEEYYEKNGLSIEIYEAHLKADYSIITLLSSNGQFLMLPSTYILGWPSGDVVPYVVVGMVASLGALPNTIDPSFLKEKIDNVILDSLGHHPNVEFVTLSEVTNKPWTEHVAMEAARTNAMRDNNTDYARRVIAEANLAAAIVQVKALQKFIVDNGLAT